MADLENILIDLRAYKIALYFHGNKETLTLYFDTPSRRFYFSFIAFIACEMKKLDKPGFIYIRKHEDTLKFLDNSLSRERASKNIEDLWDKLRKAWRYRLPELESASFFKIIDRDLSPPGDKGLKARYRCSEYESDIWANLFEYDKKNKWQYKLGIDLLSINMDCVIIRFGDLEGESAWKEYLKSFASSGYPAESLQKINPDINAKASIAVLPFDNMSGDPAQEYFSDGITEDIITALSKVPKISVIARNSTFTYKGKPVNVKDIGQDLGVQYILEGSVQRSSDRIRITAQLCETETEHHIWAERYDRNSEDIFAIQDEIAMKILIELQVKLTAGKSSRLWAKGTDNIEIYTKYLKAVYYSRSSPEEVLRARVLLKEIIDVEPDYAAAYVTLGMTYLGERGIGYGDSSEDFLEKAYHATQMALSLDPDNPRAKIQLSRIYLQKGQFEKALELIENCTKLNPDFGEAHSSKGRTLIMMGKPEEALPYLKKGLSLDPLDGLSYGALGRAYQWLERYEDAIAYFEKAKSIEPEAFVFHLHLSACYAALGNKEKAQESVKKVLELNPEFSTEKLLKIRKYRDPSYKTRLKKLFLKAGLPK